MLPLLQDVAAAAQTSAHPLSGTTAQWLWLVPVLPLLGFLINGALSLVVAYHAGPSDPNAAHGDDRANAEHEHAHAHDSADEHGARDEHGDDHHAVKRHKFAGITSIVGPGVLLLSFALAAAIWMAMRNAGGGEMAAPFIQRYFSWMPVGDMRIDAMFQLDQLS